MPIFISEQAIAARIIGYIRQAAIGDSLVPYAQRVDQALQRIIASRPWTAPQRQWLQRIAAQTKANLIVDRAAFDEPDLIFKLAIAGKAQFLVTGDADLLILAPEFGPRIVTAAHLLETLA